MSYGNILQNCALTSESFDGETLHSSVITADAGYTFFGSGTPSIRDSELTVEYMNLNDDGTVASWSGDWYVGDTKSYKYRATAVEAAPVPVQQFLHDFTQIPDIDGCDFGDWDRTKAFDSGSTVSSIFPDFIDNLSGYSFTKSENVTATFTDSSGVSRTIEAKYNSLDSGYLSDLTTTQLNYTVASNVVWNIPIYKIEPVVVKHTIKQTLTNCQSDCSLTEIVDATPLTIIVRPTSGYTFQTVPTCEMGSTAIVASQLENGYTFVIDSVTADVTLVAEAVSEIPTDVNNADYGFINIYNPTKSELKEASSKWFYSMTSGSYIDLSKYISALFITYGKPLVLSEKESIKFSSYDTTVMAHVVREPKIEVDCGTITVSELHHNALDYSPNSSVRIFLPFIGYENIDIDLIMNSELSLKYVIDCLSGKCIAKLQCSKSNGLFDIYTFVGDCSLQVPYYMNNTEDMSNSIVTRAYNLDDRTPFLLIERASAYMPNSSQLDGVQSNELAILGDLRGYTKCKEVNVYGIDCTHIEKEEIDSLLKKGVIL